MLGNIFTRDLQRFVHFTQDMQTAYFGLGQSRAHDLTINTVDFDIHLQGRDTFTGTDHLEIHITKMIFITQYIGQDNNLLALLD